MKKQYVGMAAEKVSFVENDIVTKSDSNCWSIVTWLNQGGVCVSDDDMKDIEWYGDHT